MSFELMTLGFAALVGGIAAGAVHELSGKGAAITWVLLDVTCLAILYVL